MSGDKSHLVAGHSRMEEKGPSKGNIIIFVGWR